MEQNLLELWVVFIATCIHTNYYWILMLKYSVWGKITLPLDREETDVAYKQMAVYKAKGGNPVLG